MAEAPPLNGPPPPANPPTPFDAPTRFEGRSHIFPQKLIFGARPLPVPGAGHVMCCSAVLPFRLGDGSPAPPNDYFKAVATFGGETAIPDAMAPLPGSEVLVMGPVPGVEGDERRAELRCGDLHCQLLIRSDGRAPDQPLLLGPEAGLWHEQDNPAGRGGPGDDRRPLIVMANQPERPVWLGSTPYLHPARASLMGISDQFDAGGWPADASPSVMCDSHPAFWTDSLHPGDPLRVVGLGEREVELELPPFRPNLASSRAPDGHWVSDFIRIHAIVLLPAADLGAVIWRSAIELGSGDPLGESVSVLVFALEDIAAPERDEQDLAEIAAVRWHDPSAALDDGPLLPESMREPPPPQDLSAYNDRYAAAEAWARQETGLGDHNPFDESDLAKEAEELADPTAPDPMMNLDDVAAIGKQAVERGRQRHEEAGFPPPDPEAEREPLVRGDALDAEIEERLRAPFRAPQEVAIASGMALAPPEVAVDPEATLTRLAEARITGAEPVLFWPALIPAEAERFGARALESLRAADPVRHIDISSTAVAGTPGAGATVVEGRTFDRLLAEETVWRDVEFRDCVFRECSFVKARLEDLSFARCTFDKTNFSNATLERLAFRDCVFQDQVLRGMNWIDVHLEGCEMTSVTLMDWAVRDTTFSGGFWEQVQVNDCLLVSVTFQDLAHREVTWAMTHAPYTRFERVTFHKVWLAAMGFPECVFESVEAETCGFLGSAYFNGSRFANVRFTEAGFTKATFNEAQFSRDCVFVRCDFTSAVFIGARLARVRFLHCAMSSTVWGERVDASSAWFHGCILRGVDFMDTRLTNAVFTDADLEGALMGDDLSAGADFRGTVRGG